MLYIYYIYNISIIHIYIIYVYNILIIQGGACSKFYNICKKRRVVTCTETYLESCQTSI